MRDCLVCGIREVGVQRQLLAEPDLKFRKAFELAQSAEAAERDSKTHKTTIPHYCQNRLPYTMWSLRPTCRGRKVHTNVIAVESHMLELIAGLGMLFVLVAKRTFGQSWQEQSAAFTGI